MFLHIYPGFVSLYTDPDPEFYNTNPDPRFRIRITVFAEICVVVSFHVDILLKEEMNLFCLMGNSVYLVCNIYTHEKGCLD